MTASMDFCVTFTPDETQPLGVRVAERGEREVFCLEGEAILAWDEDRPKAVELHPMGWTLARPRMLPVPLTGPLADMALERVNQDHYALMEAWRNNQDGEKADAMYEAAE